MYTLHKPWKNIIATNSCHTRLLKCWILKKICLWIQKSNLIFVFLCGKNEHSGYLSYQKTLYCSRTTFNTIYWFRQKRANKITISIKQHKNLDTKKVFFLFELTFQSYMFLFNKTQFSRFYRNLKRMCPNNF